MNDQHTCGSCGQPISQSEGCPECETVELRQQLKIPGYSIVRSIGRGGMGVVFLAEDQALDRTVAIKVMSEEHSRQPEARARFVREARIMATVDHPGVVRVHTFGEVDGQSYLVMEYVEGESLDARIHREGALDPNLAMQILSEAAEALNAAWSNGVIHRDIKPANILIDREGRVRVADFGLSRSLSLSGATQLTATGATLGTPAYISPEQARADRDPDLRTDIYSLGIVLYEMLTGSRPFRGSSPFQVVDQHLHKNMPDPRISRPQISASIAHLVRVMTEKAPEDRPETFEKLRGVIDEATPSRENFAPVVGHSRKLIAFVISGVVFAAITFNVVINRVQTGRVQPAKPQAVINPNANLRVELREVWKTRKPGAGSKSLFPGMDSTIEITSDDNEVTVKEKGMTIRLSPELAGSLISPRTSVFFDEHNRFTSEDVSLRAMSLNIDRGSGLHALRLVALAGGWPVILISGQQPAQASALSLDLKNVPWDVVAQHLLKVLDRKAIRVGDVWLIADPSHTKDVQQRLGLKGAIRRPRAVTTEQMASALEFVRSETSVVLVSQRLDAVLIADNIDAFGDYARVWSATQGIDTGRSSTSLHRYFGDPLTLSLIDADARDTFSTFGQMTGLNIVVPPDLECYIQLLVSDVPWDNLIEALVVAVGLTSSLDADVLHLRWPEQQPDDIVVEIVRLENEDPALFEPIKDLLTSEGDLRIDFAARTITIRDHNRRARWIRDWIREIDSTGPAGVETGH